LGFRNLLFKFLPRCFHLPANYYYMKYRGAIEYELLILDELFSGRNLCIDVGANDGVYTYKLAKFCGRVEAFEPQPGCCDLIKAYRAQNINVHCVALSDAPGVLNLNIPAIKGKAITGYATFNEISESHTTIPVPLRRLDDFSFKDVSFIKIDVEGHESRVLSGAKETILREQPVILIEIEQRHLGETPITDIFEQITNLGYKGFFLLNKKCYSINEFSLKDHQDKFLNDFSNKDYVNNFIFRPC
jgi:FkbM family methyltransferase